MRTAIAIVLLLLLCACATASQTEVRGARVWSEPDHTLLVLDLAAPMPHQVFAVDDPGRLVIDLPDARLIRRLPAVPAGDPLISGLRSGIRAGDDLRIVVDLKRRVRSESRLLPPEGKYGHRLAVTLSPTGRTAAPVTDATQSRPAPVTDATAAPAPLATRTTADRPRMVIIAIDAGHGGKDPGAIGAKGAKEKDVTLSIARHLARLIKKERGMRGVLVRDADVFISLRRRMEIARGHRADLFVSIHADAYQDQSARGSSVYTLSPRGASSEAAKWLADKENSADLIGGVDLPERDGMLASVLFDMTQNATLEHSGIAAKRVLAHLRQVGAVHRDDVQRAGFVVLKSPDIPSLLVETAFITNPREERRLTHKDHQEALARAILGGIRAYFRAYPPPGTVLANDAARRRHTIDSGETLDDIARQYRVSPNALRSQNGIAGDRIRVGQVLTIPEG